MWTVLGLCVGLALGSSHAFAEKLLGIESGEETQSADIQVDKKSSAPAAKAAPASDTAATKLSQSDGAAETSNDLTFSGSFSASKDVLGGQATVGYWINRYVGVEATYAYSQIDTNSDDGVQYGPDVAGVLKAPNPTIVTPFVGIGPGYVKWQRSHNDEVFDEGASVTGNVFGGINVNLTRHFGLQIVRRQTTYYNDPPKIFADRVTREEPTRLGTSVGFYMSF